MSSMTSDCRTSKSSDTPWRPLDLLRILTDRAAEGTCCTEVPTSSRPRDHLRSASFMLLGELVRHGPTIVDRLVRSRTNGSRQRHEERNHAMESTYSTPLPVVAPPTGGCGCCTPAPPVQSIPVTPAQEDTMPITASYPAVGLTCGHCVGAVTEEILALPGVREVSVDLVAGGTSTLTVTSDSPVPDDALAAALDEAGDYRLVSN